MPMKQEQIETMKQAGYVSVSKASKLAMVEVSTIHRWIKVGRLDATQVGSYWYVTVDSLITSIGPVLAKATGLLKEDAHEVASTEP